MTGYEATVANLLKREKFQELDCLADHLRSSKERFHGGTWKIHVFYAGLNDPAQYPNHATNENWEQMLQHLKKWELKYPRSTTAHVALASAYIENAWYARGEGYAETVSDNGWNLFEKRTAQARQMLEEATGLPDKCPEWYLVMLEVAEAQGWDIDQAHQLFEKAFKFEPGYYYYSRVYANYLQPKWQGEPGDTERFSQEIADRVGGDEGDILYFQIANLLMCGCDDSPKFFWPRIAKGFEATEKHYGTSMLNLNLIAHMSYVADDLVLSHHAFTRIGNEWDQKTWGSEKNFKAAKEMVDFAAPPLEKKLSREAAANANLQAPGGASYQVLFEKKYRRIIEPCMKQVSEHVDDLETLTAINADGSIEDIRIYGNGGVPAMCMYQKLSELKQNGAKAFDPAPAASYWVRFDLKSTEFVPVISKKTN